MYLRIILIAVMMLAVTGVQAATSKIHFCALDGDVACIKQAIESGDSVNAKSGGWSMTALDIALIRRHRDAARYLVDHGAKPKRKRTVMPDTIALAAASGNTYVIEKFKNRLDSIDQRFMFSTTFMNVKTMKAPRGKKTIFVTGEHVHRFYGRMRYTGSYFESTLLHIATMTGQTEMMRYLLGKGARVDVPKVRGKVTRKKPLIRVDLPIHSAALSGNLETLAILVEKGADINAPNPQLNTPLHYAVAADSAAMIVELIKRGAEPGRVNKRNQTPHLQAQQDKKMNALQAFAGVGYKQNVFELIASGNETKALAGIGPDNINKTDSLGETILHKAVRQKSATLGQRLVERGAKIDVRNKDGETALFLAAKMYQDDLIRILLNQGADPNQNNNRGNSLMFSYFPYGKASALAKQDVFQLFLSKGVDINMTNASGNNLLYHLVNTESPLVAFAVQQGADVNHRNPRSRDTPFIHYASKSPKLDILKIMLAANADINSVNKQKVSFLTGLMSKYSIIPGSNYYKMVELLMSKGANINHKDRWGNTPLSLEVRDENLPLIRLLIQKGAKPNYKHPRYGKLTKYVRYAYKRTTDPKRREVYEYFKSNDFRMDKKLGRQARR